MSRDPKQPDDEPTPDPAATEPPEAKDVAEKIEEKGEPFDGNFA